MVLLSLAGREEFNPISLDASAGLVTGIRPTTEKVWNVDLRLFPTFAALPQDVKNEIPADSHADSHQGVFHLTPT